MQTLELQAELLSGIKRKDLAAQGASVRRGRNSGGKTLDVAVKSVYAEKSDESQPTVVNAQPFKTGSSTGSSRAVVAAPGEHIDTDQDSEQFQICASSVRVPPISSGPLKFLVLFVSTHLVFARTLRLQEQFVYIIIFGTPTNCIANTTYTHSNTHTHTAC